ncbi:LOW QUALITY PROTEIN: RNA-binding protein 28-like [Amphiura filiformis]|uniref:LOW QUALITY PROTEIN: RNA-binding protein 28-like n=1 Tax=Amphiura filiformis TaxID=82378 RepID=UPI003B216D20
MASFHKRGAEMEEKPIAKCTLFVRNLPYDATNEGLEEVFSEVGPIKSCFVVKERGVSDKCRGFGFVTYADRADAEKAIASSKSLDGRKLHCKYADKKPPSNFGNKKKQFQQTEIPGAAKTSPTKHSFSILTMMMTMDGDDDDGDDDDDDNNNASGKVNVNQKKKQSPQKLPQNQQGQRANKKSPVEPPKGKTNGEGRTSNKNQANKPQPAPNKAQGQQFNKKDGKDQKFNKKAEQKGKPSSSVFKPPQGKAIGANEKSARLVVRNLSFKCDEDALQKAFSTYGSISEVKIPLLHGPPHGKRSRGFGFVQFKEIDSAAKAVKKMNGTEIMGRPIAVDWSLPREKFLAASKQASASAPKTDKPKPKPKPKASSSSDSVSSDEDESDGDDSDDEEEDSDDDESDDDESDDDESSDEQKAGNNKQAAGKSPQKALKFDDGKIVDDDSEDDDEEDDSDGDDDEESDDEDSDDDDEEVEEVKKNIPVKSSKASLPRSKPAAAAADDDDSSSEESDDSGTGEDSGDSEDDSGDEKRKAGVKQDSDSGSISDEEDDDSDEDDDDGSDGEESDSDEDEDASKQKKEEPAKPSDVGEGKTLFVRNVPFEATDEDLTEIFGKFGRLEVCRVVMDKDTEHSKGSAFVKYVSKEEAEKCLRKASAQDEKFTLDGRRLEVTMALPRNDIEGMRKALKKQEKSVNKDKRNLYLLREGLVREGTQAAKGVSEADMAKRTKVENIKRNKLKNINIFISPTRMVVHNLPKTVDDAKLKKIFLEAAVDKKARVTESRVMRDMKRPNAEGTCQPLGFAFVEFTEHEHALTALRHVNNNPTYFGENKRPIVGFSLENKIALEAKQKRLGKSHQNKAAQRNEQRDRGKTGPSQSEVAKKTHIASLSKEKIHAAPKTKIRKGLPSHMGPKRRWRDKGKLPPPKKDKNRFSRAKKQQLQQREPKEPQNMKRPADEQQTGNKNKRRRKNAERREESNFNKVVAQYKNKLFGNVERTNVQRKQPKSKWFDNS